MTSRAETGSSAIHEARSAHDRAGDGDALTLATGQLARIAVGVTQTRPTSSSTSFDALLVVRNARRLPQSFLDRVPPIVIRGSSDEYGSWKTNLCS